MTTVCVFFHGWQSKYLDAFKYIVSLHQCSATTKWLSQLKMSNVYGNFENEIFNSPHVSDNFPQFSFSWPWLRSWPWPLTEGHSKILWL